MTSAASGKKNQRQPEAASEFSTYSCRGLLHSARGSLLFFGQAVNFVYVHAAGGGIHDCVNSNAMTDERLHGVFIINRVDFFAVFVNKYGVLAGIQTFLPTCLVPSGSALDAAL
jgi:hypothetical protein